MRSHKLLTLSTIIFMAVSSLFIGLATVLFVRMENLRNKVLV